MHELVRVPLLALLLTSAVAAQQATCIPGVTATVDPPCAPMGSTVTLTVHNGSDGFLVMPSSCLWQAIFAGECGGKIINVPYCLWVLTFIAPGESVSSTWDQRDQDGNQVVPGTYVFSVPDTCCVPFTVCGNCEEPPFKYGEVSYGTFGYWPRLDTAGGMPSPGNSDFRLTLSFCSAGGAAAGLGDAVRAAGDALHHRAAAARRAAGLARRGRAPTAGAHPR